VSQDHPSGAGTDALDFIQAVHALLQCGILLEQGFNLLFHRLDLGLEMGQELGMLAADKDNMGWSGWEEFRNLIPYDKTNLQEQR
jgi:hypothetical protein